MLVLRSKHLIGRGAKGGRVQFVGAHLLFHRITAGAVAYRGTDAVKYRENIGAAATQGRRGFAAENEFLRKLFLKGTGYKGGVLMPLRCE